MTGSPGSASADPAAAAPAVLMVGVNWIGDAVMSMPAVQAWRALNPAARLTMLVKPPLAPLWRMHAAPDDVAAIEPGSLGAVRTGLALRARHFDRAYILPHSFRAAWIAAWSGAPERIGLPGLARGLLGVRVVQSRSGPDRAHQQFEYLDLLLGPGAAAAPEPPRLRIPPEAAASAARWLAGLPAGPRVAMMSGAARGPAKRWPVERFAEAARRLAADHGCAVIALGSPAEAADAAAIAAAAGGRGLSLAGRTDISQWAAVLAGCALAVSNDSGGMHLAAAAGTPVVAVFGRTDPGRTGPLGPLCDVVQAPGARSRDIGREDEDAVRRLAAVTVDEVMDRCVRRLARGGATGGGRSCVP
ncbi:MAG: lipopolysaccharide heptosyltransferase II [Verrucomicrobia bacterium A1]|nr:MAG: lipopolysaccharide heptosyltransferase II [Verrucomicrobia bacterium A1]